MSAVAVSVQCCDCRHADSLDDHPMLVRCSRGEPALGLCGFFWKTDSHLCRSFGPLTLDDLPSCAHCGGDGIESEGTRCPECGGTGYAFPRSPEGAS